MHSLNAQAASIVNKLAENADELKIVVQKSSVGATILDCGVNAEGSYEAGRLIIEVCLAGLGKARLVKVTFDGRRSAATLVSTTSPTLACIGSQMAGWKIKTEKYFALGSGPARILSKTPQEVYELLNYSEPSDIAVLVLEANKLPPDTVLEQISKECEVSPSQLYVLVASTASPVGSVQISGRAAESGLHRLLTLGFDVRKVKYAAGIAPIAPLVKDDLKMMGMVNDAIFYAGKATYTADLEGIDVESLLAKIPASTSKDYGTPFYELLKKADFDFYKIDPALFSVAEVTITDAKTGKEYRAGKADFDLLMASFEQNTLVLNELETKQMSPN